MSRATVVGTRFACLLLTPGMLFLAAFLVVPGILLVMLSLRDVDGMLMMLPSYGFSHYLNVFSSPSYRDALLSTLWVAGLTAVLCVLLAGHGERRRRHERATKELGASPLWPLILNRCRPPQAVPGASWAWPCCMC